MSDFVRRKSGHRRLATVFVGSQPLGSVPESSGLELDSQEARLVVTGGEHNGREFLLYGKRVIIGRDQDADVMIDEPSASRRHAQIELRGDEFFLRDLGSTNGTFFDGLLHGAEKSLADGDRFKIGNTCFLFRGPSD